MIGILKYKLSDDCAKIMTLDEFFDGHVESRKLFEAVAREVSRIGEAGLRVSKSQIAFRRRKSFALVWMPGKYLKGPVPPLVLTLSFPQRDHSPRWKEVVQAGPRRFTHHLELRKVEDLDDQVRTWLRSAWEAA